MFLSMRAWSSPMGAHTSSASACPPSSPTWFSSTKKVEKKRTIPYQSFVKKPDSAGV